jgi:hypothetical protein
MISACPSANLTPVKPIPVNVSLQQLLTSDTQMIIRGFVDIHLNSKEALHTKIKSRFVMLSADARIRK